MRNQLKVLSVLFFDCLYDKNFGGFHNISRQVLFAISHRRNMFPLNQKLKKSTFQAL